MNHREASASGDTRATAGRRCDLARMRGLATGLLVLMTAVFIATRLAPAGWLWPAYVGAFAEAAMVGALADWFAVTALFRRPLGLPIPHTAIIPRNRDRIGAALGEFIAGNFLAPAVVDERLRRLEPARRLAAWLADPAVVVAVARRIALVAPHLLAPDGAWRDVIVDLARRLAATRPLAPTAARLLRSLWAAPPVQAGFNRLVSSMAAWLTAQEPFIQDQVAGSFWRWAPKWLDRMLAEKFTHGLMGALDGLGDPSHPWRADLALAVEGLIDRLETDPEMIERGEALKARLLAELAQTGRIDLLWSVLSGQEGPDEGAGGALLREMAERGLRAVGQWLAEDAAAREAVDRWILAAARRGLSSQRGAIGGFVAQVVSGWNAEEVADRLELQVGRDLQYIRISGALVGGLAGLVIFTVARWLA